MVKVKNKKLHNKSSCDQNTQRTKHKTTPQQFCSN